MKKSRLKEQSKRTRLVAALTGLAALSSVLHPVLLPERVHAFGLQENDKQIGQTESGQIAYPSLEVARRLLFHTDIYDAWQWNEASLPQDMLLGMLMASPKNMENMVKLPPEALKMLQDTDFSRNIVFYAYLGSKALPGYAVAIASVGEIENNVTVTVRMKSPVMEEALKDTKPYDLVRIPRGILDFRRQVNITFEDGKGKVLGRQTITVS